MIDSSSSTGPSFVVRLLVGFGAAGVVSLLVLLIGTQQDSWAQPDPGAASSPSPSSQVYCGPWEIEGGQGEGTWVYWNVRWCYSPEVSGGWYRDYAGNYRTDPNVTQTITPSADSVALGQPVTFHITETNNAPYALASLRVSATLLNPSQFVSATPSQGRPCSNHAHENTTVVICDLGRLPAGATAVLDVVLIPQELGTNEAFVTDYAGYSGSEDTLGTPLHTNDARTSVQVTE